MSVYIQTHSKVKRTVSRIVTAARPIFIGKISLSFVLLAFIGVVGVVFMINFNSSATMGYNLTRLESERDELKTAQEQQNINLSRSQSLEYIRTSQRVGIMVPVNEVEYYDGQIDVAYTGKR